MGVGFKIKKLRESVDLSQPELADILEISQSKLSNIENGRNQKEIDVKLMDKICRYFNKDFAYFLDDETVVNNIKENKGQVSCSNFTINNTFPDDVLLKALNLIDELQKLLKEQQKSKE